MAQYVGTTNPTTGTAASPGNGWWFNGQFSGGEPVYYQAALPAASPPPPSSPASPASPSSSGASAAPSVSAASSTGFWGEDRRRPGLARPEVSEPFVAEPGLFTPNPWVANHGLSAIEEAISQGIPLPAELTTQLLNSFLPDAEGILDPYTGMPEPSSVASNRDFRERWDQMSDSDKFYRTIEALQSIENDNNRKTFLDKYGKQLTLAGLAAITGGLAGGAMAAAGYGATASGAVGGAAAGGTGAALRGSNIGKGALIGGLSGGAGSAVGGMLPAEYEGYAPAAQGVTGAAASTLARGGNLDDFWRSALIQGGIPAAAEFSYPYVNDAMAGSSPMMPAAVPEADPTFGGMLENIAPGMFAAPEFTSQFDVEDAAMEMSPAVADARAAEVLAAEQPGLVEEPPAEAERRGITSKEAQQYAKVAQTVARMLGGNEGSDGTPADAPTQDEGETPEQYATELAAYAVEHLSLDLQAMAEQGLQPGTAEYYDYIMSQADSIIAQTLGDIDPDAADLAQQLRGKTQQELLALQRALFVRGQLDQLMGTGTYTDPATGLPQEVIGQGMFNPAVGAYQRGLAQNVEELAGAEDPRAYLDTLLNRDVDMFGMQQAQNERLAKARREELEDEEQRRRRYGMFGGNY